MSNYRIEEHTVRIVDVPDEVVKQIRTEAIDDFCNEINTCRMYDEYGNVIDLLEIAKRLKEKK